MLSWVFFKRKQIYTKTPTNLMTNDDNENNNKKKREGLGYIYMFTKKKIIIIKKNPQ